MLLAAFLADVRSNVLIFIREMPCFYDTHSLIFFHHLNYAKYNLFLFCFLFIENVRVCIVVQFLIFLDLSDSQVALTTRSKTV